MYIMWPPEYPSIQQYNGMLHQAMCYFIPTARKYTIFRYAKWRTNNTVNLIIGKQKCSSNKARDSREGPQADELFFCRIKIALIHLCNYPTTKVSDLVA
jgi:hypothetical protein